MPTAILSDRPHPPKLAIRSVSWSSPFGWLRRGWRDLREDWRVSLAHGAIIALFWLMLLGLIGTHPYAIAALLSGFMLIGPAMTSGLCELSRRRATGEPLSFDGSLEGFSRNREAMMKFSGVLAGLTVAWFIASVLLLRAVFNQAEPTLAEILYGGLFDASAYQHAIPYVATGGILAVLVFAVSVVAVPLMIDRHASAGTAMHTSVRAVLANLPAMLVWSLLLVGLVGLGVLSGLAGLVVTLPLMGHATWHAYQDLVR